MAIISAIVGVIKAVPIIDSWFQQIIAFYMSTQTNETLSEIADAAALSAHATSEEERYVAAEAWRKAMSRPRILP
jgi:hypothetical protein